MSPWWNHTNEEELDLAKASQVLRWREAEVFTPSNCEIPLAATR